MSSLVCLVSVTKGKVLCVLLVSSLVCLVSVTKGKGV